MLINWIRCNTTLAVGCAALALMMAGCSGGATDSAAPDYTSVRSMGQMYELYQGENRGQSPQDEQAFRAFLATKQESLERLKLTVDDMFVSPRNGQPLIWIYGMRPPTGPGGAYLAYEKTPVDGKRLVLGARGIYEEMDEAQFKKLFPNAP